MPLNYTLEVVNFMFYEFFPNKKIFGMEKGRVTMDRIQMNHII